MNNLETKLKDIFDKIKKSSSLREINDLNSQAWDLSRSEEAPTDMEIYRWSECLFAAYQRSKEIFREKGRENLTDKELDLLEKVVDFYQGNALKLMWGEVPVWVKKHYKDHNDFNSSAMKDTNEAKSVFRNNYFSKPKKAPKQVDIYDERE